MKKFINFYLDESGAPNSEFFTVAGFYNFSDDYQKIIKINGKVKTKILYLEKQIKEYRRLNEPKLDQFIISEENNNHKEVKWNTLSTNNKKFLINNLKNYNQKNISITSNLKKWISKDNRKGGLDSIYNIMVLYLIERTLNNLYIDNNDEIDVNIYIDQRKVAPNIYNKNGIKLESLEGYIKTTWFYNQKFLKSNLQVVQFDSSSNALIRYADYYAGLINSMCRFLSPNTNFKWDEDIDLMFSELHKKLYCKCHYTIKDQCEIINELSKKCMWSNF